HYRTPEPFDPAAEPLAALEKAKRETSDAALFQFLAERIPSNKEREKIALLLPELGQVSFAARERATAALRQFGVKAAAPLRQAADSDDSEVVRRATQLLEKIAQDPAMACTTAVVRLLAVRRPAGTAAALLAYYPWACDEATGKEVLYALAAVVEGDAAAKKVVEAALDDADPRVRTAASCVLGTDGGVFLKQP